MAKKRKAPRSTEPSGPKDIDAKDARLTIKTYADVANSEDEYYIEKDRIDFDDDDDEPRKKRLRKQEREDEFLEASDEEVFADDAGDSDEESGEEEGEEEEAAAEPAAAEPAAAKRKGAAKKGRVVSEDEDEAEENDEGDLGWWGSSRKEYYDNDVIQTENDALEEETEARRIQAKKLAKMEEADYAFDEGDWLAPKEKSSEDNEDVIVEVLKDIEVTDDMGPEERYKLLQTRYPEFDYLVDEFRDLQPLLATYQSEAEGKPAKSLEVVQFWVLGCYVASLASYFAILTSPTRDGDGSAKTLSPAELRDHEIMETLVSCRAAWLKVKSLRSLKKAIETAEHLSPIEEDLEASEVAVPAKKKSKKSSKAEARALEKKAASKAKKAKAVEKSLADLSTLLKSNKKAPREEDEEESESDVATEDRMDEDDNRSDFGEAETIDARTAAEKVQRKKSLKFYTSQIVQKASRRADAGRDAGGDNDIPYRERLRDRQARLNLEAERRGKKAGKPGAELGGDDSDDGEANVAKGVREEEDSYYDFVAHKAAKKKDDKAARFEAVAQAKKTDRIVETAAVGADGKRQISYQIQKNKGLMPHRKKEVRNPRVKKRMMYEAKQKKLKSVKPTYQGGESKGGYQGEASGIKTGLVKSTKL
ncbi:Sas10 C-terminal domain-containing protein [Bombardia bombarda]|uniref:Sas10 C-terminal domain-containing protein n=1 Tax=Bombardia bombarda TaxID=252184 RepID=A0AA40CAZ5_9PEZI|nr:Sas10 C-terminal domain-containing protein [Bombardia bombarda]